MSFGDLALETSGAKRSATIKCTSTDCEFATLNKENFLKAMGNIKKKRNEKVIDFFETLPCFSQLSRRLISKYINQMEKVKYKCGKIVYNEGESAKKVFFVYKGDFE